ncbi:hypothetical protein [Streptomyces antibioticus]|uniref:hypothetical protein n=1 Tax=Streptomyces antibioticus TaxID=1890 RepID=UPI0033E3A138
MSDLTATRNGADLLADARAAAAMKPNPEPGTLAAYLHAALAEVDRLTELVDRYRAPLPGGPSTPKEPDRSYALMEERRTEAESGYTDYEPFVGMVLCPAREKCPSGLLGVFRPMKDGRLPMHRDTYGHPCPGAHHKPVTPALELRPQTPPAEDRAPGNGAAWVDVRRAERISFGVRRVDTEEGERP